MIWCDMALTPSRKSRLRLLVLLWMIGVQLTNCGAKQFWFLDISYTSSYTRYKPNHDPTWYGNIYSPDTPNDFNTATTAHGLLNITNLPDSPIWIKLEDWPESPSLTTSCREHLPLTFTSPTGSLSTWKKNCNTHQDQTRHRAMQIIGTTPYLVLQLREKTENQPGFVVKLSISENINHMINGGRTIDVTPKTATLAQTKIGFITSHESFNLGAAGSLYPGGVKHEITLNLEPATTAVKIEFVFFNIGAVQVPACEQGSNINNNENYYFSIQNGNNMLYRCGGCSWLPQIRNFNTISSDTLRFHINPRNSRADWSGIMIKYTVKSCRDIQHGEISRQAGSNNGFTITCENGDTSNHNCVDNNWESPSPVCSPVTTAAPTTAAPTTAAPTTAAPTTAAPTTAAPTTAAPTTAAPTTAAPTTAAQTTAAPTTAPPTTAAPTTAGQTTNVPKAAGQDNNMPTSAAGEMDTEVNGDPGFEKNESMHRSTQSMGGSEFNQDETARTESSLRLFGQSIDTKIDGNFIVLILGSLVGLVLLLLVVIILLAVVISRRQSPSSVDDSSSEDNASNVVQDKGPQESDVPDSQNDHEQDEQTPNDTLHVVTPPIGALSKNSARSEKIDEQKTNNTLYVDTPTVGVVSKKSARSKKSKVKQR